MHRYPNVPGCVNVKLNDDPGANGPELNAPPVAVQVCVTVSLFVTVTVDPSGTDTLDGLKAKFEMLIATCTGGTVVVVAGEVAVVESSAEVAGEAALGRRRGRLGCRPGYDPVGGRPRRGGCGGGRGT